jgi:hypothetical protein
VVWEGGGQILTAPYPDHEEKCWRAKNFLNIEKQAG